VQAALDWALANAKKNPTPENIAIAKDTFAARQQTLANQPSSAELAKSVNTAVSELPQTYKDINTTISDIDKQIADVNTAGQEAGVISQSMGGPGWNYVNDTGKPVGDTSREDAYQKLYDEFNALGLGALVADAKDLLMKATSISAMPDALRNTQAYRTRFSANDARVAAGLRALDPATYLLKEDQYQNVMRQYGLPASYYATGQYGKQEGFDKLLANDVSAVELEDRIATAQQRVLNTNPEVLQALKKFYPDLNNADILAYTLDPANALQNIKRKVTAAEIGGAALAQGLQAQGGTAESLAGQGITKSQAQQGYTEIAGMLPRASQLSDIYNQGPYNQQTAEAEVFNTAGAAAATAKRKKLGALETAAFSGSSGVGALGRDKAAYGLTQGQTGLY
jgi:hypothetical protein